MAMNKLERIEKDIEKTKGKIAELQKQLRELEAAKTEQENMQIVQLVRGLNMTPQEYQNYVRRKQKKSPLGKDMALAFLIGGLICAAGQGILNGWLAAGLREEDAAAATSISLVFLSALLTALNLYNKLARFGGAGTLVPITGFANAVVSPAIDFRAEGIVTGTAAKMFVIAGPVIVFGTAASALYGLILWLVG